MRLILVTIGIALAIWIGWKLDSVNQTGMGALLTVFGITAIINLACQKTQS